MEPGIGRSIREGFRAANRSWAGMGFFLGCWFLVTMIAVVLLSLTRPPQELFQQRTELPAGERTLTPPVLPATSQPTHKTDMFKQLASTESTPAPAGDTTTATATVTATTTPSSDVTKAALPAAAAPTPASEAAKVAMPAATPAKSAETIKRQRAAEQDRIVADWFKRAWPALLFCVAMFIVVNVWLSGGQIGYLAKLVNRQPATVSDFVATGTASFGTLLGASLVLLLALGGLSLLVALVVVLLSALSRVTPGWFVGILGLLLGLGAIIGLLWLFVRAAFWFIAIVIEHQGIVNGLKASFRASRGRWWPVAGLGVVMVAIGYGVWVPFGILEWVGNLIGGGTAVGLGLISNVVGLVASLYVGFTTLAAYLCFYTDAKTTPAQPPVGAVTP